MTGIRRVWPDNPFVPELPKHIRDWWVTNGLLYVLTEDMLCFGPYRFPPGAAIEIDWPGPARRGMLGWLDRLADWILWKW